jgi:hypothetical protein
MGEIGGGDASQQELGLCAVSHLVLIASSSPSTVGCCTKEAEADRTPALPYCGCRAALVARADLRSGVRVAGYRAVGGTSRGALMGQGRMQSPTIGKESAGKVHPVLWDVAWFKTSHGSRCRMAQDVAFLAGSPAIGRLGAVTRKLL